MKLRNLIAGVCALCGGAVSATAEMVKYWDPVGKVTKSVNATVVTASTATLADGWYVVKGTVSRAQIKVTGTDAIPANLILADGAVLTVTESGEDNPGIRVESGKTLNIYAQSTDANAMGRLSATSDKYGAGIGGGKWKECGTVNIYGGNVMAKGGNCGAGIGGGHQAKGGMVNIYDGVVTASCCGDSAAGIGGGGGGYGSGAEGGTVNIFGGMVTATGGSAGNGGAGIGGGGQHKGGTITISGGRVTATGGGNGAGIGGGGDGGAGGTITISGGMVMATGGGEGAGIGGGQSGDGGKVTISGGTVVAKSGDKGVRDIGSGSGKDTGDFYVKGGSVLLANSGLCRSGYPKNGDGTQVYCVTNQFVDDVGKGVAVRFPSAPFAYGDKDIFTDDAKQVYLWLPKTAGTYTIAYENKDGTFKELTPESVPVPGTVNVFKDPQTTVTYAKPDGTLANADAIPVDARRTLLLGGNWYVVTNVVSMSQSLEVVGSANLILADGAKLTVQAPMSERHAGVEVADGNALTIWGQDGNTGTLDATGGGSGAGIGGGDGVTCGTVTINGGTVMAAGVDNGAGIGGGNGGAGGAVTNAGGTVVAKAGNKRVWDIGSGCGGGDVGKFVVTGGSVQLANSKECRPGCPKNAGGDTLYRVTIPFPTGFVENVAISVTNIVRDGKSYPYGGRKLFVRDDGLYLYLPNGTYEICLAVGTSGSAKATAKVYYAQTTAALITGAFLVNGASLMSKLPGGCIYNSGVLTVSGAGPYVFSGSPQELPLRVEVTTNANATIILSNVVIAVTNDQPVLTVAGGATLTLQIAEGRSEFESKGGKDAIAVESGAKLVLGATPAALAETRLCVKGGVKGATNNVSCAGGVILKEGATENEATLTPTCSGKAYLELGKSATVKVAQLPDHMSAEIDYGPGTPLTLAPTGGVYTVMQNDDIKIRFTPDEGYGLDFTEISCGRIKDELTVKSDELPGVHPLIETTYWNLDNAESQVQEAMVVDSDTATLCDRNWYVVTGEVSRAGIIVKGAANLILADGARLTVTGAAYRAGIEVAAGNALTIWDQDGHTGKLDATGGSNGAGIGGGNGVTNGTVTINGGTVMAAGAGNGAGIGGGSGGAGGAVTIAGGTVIAKAANKGTWDIGSGWGGGDVGDFFVTGGSVQLAKSGLCRDEYPKKTEDTASLRLITVTNNPNAAEGVLSPATISDIALVDSQYGLGDYNAKGVQLIGGNLYFYLEKNRAYAFKVNDGELDRYVFVPASTNHYETTATQFAVFVNRSPIMEGAGEGWAYEPGSGILSITGETCSIAGFALQSEVAMRVETNATLTTSALELMSSNSVLTIENGAAVALEAGAEVTNRFITTGDRPAVAGTGSLTVTNGTYVFRGAERAFGDGVSLAVAPQEIVLAGEDEESAVYVAADEVGDAKWVKVAPAVTLTVPVVEHATFCASNRTGRLEAQGTTESGKVKYRVLPGDVVTLFFTADDGYALNEPVLELGAVSSDTELDASDLPVVHEKPSDVSYVDKNGEELTAAEALVIGPDVTALHDGVWYVVSGAVAVAESIVVDGTAHLILADGATLTAGYDGYGPQGAPGIEVPADAKLNVYAQAGGTGRLVARGTDGAAGIGGGYFGAGGTVNICGGQVLAEGGIYAAGIGGGYKGAGGTVNIYAGTVTAVGGTMSSADIGPGYFDLYDGKTDAKVTVTGGSLIAPAIWGPAEDGKGSLVHCVLVEVERGAGSEERGAGSEEERDERVVIEGLGDYGARDIFAYVRPGETGGNIFLYLPNGNYEFKIGRAHYAATVNGRGTEAKLVYIEERPDPVPPVILAIEKGADAVTVTVETLPGLSYSLLRGATVESVRTGGTVVDGPKDATETTLTLTDQNPPEEKAFYKVEVK